MRFDYLNLKAIGHFTDYKLGFNPTKNFHLLYGSNEAGKSTTLRAITYFLYGFPQKTSDSFLHSNSKLRIEGALRDSKGEQLTFIRRKGRKDTVHDLNGNQFNEKIVDQFLQGISETYFLNMFALDHIRLRDGGKDLLENEGSVGESLFSAASGVNTLRKIIEKLDKETGQLYKKAGQNPKLNQLLKEEKRLAKQIVENQLKIQTWKELDHKYKKGKKEIDELTKKIKKLRQKQNKLLRIRQMLPKISKRQDILQKLEEIGDVPTLPDDVREIRTNEENKRNSAQTEKEKLEKEIADFENQLSNISIPELVLEQYSLINRLYQEVTTYQQNVNDIPKLNGYKEQLERQVHLNMQEIDSANAEMKNMDLFILAAEKKETIRELIKQKPLLDQALKNSEKECTKLLHEINKKQKELNKLPGVPPIDQLETVIDKVKRVGFIEENIAKLDRECQKKEKEIVDKTKALPLWNGTYEDLIDISIPVMPETVKKYEKQRSELLEELKQIKVQIKQQLEAIEQSKDSIRTLESFVVIPSEDDLINTRQTRDEGWKIIRNKLQAGQYTENLENYAKGQMVESVYEGQVLKADQIADMMRFESEKIGEKNKLLSDIEKSEQKVDDFNKKEFCLKEELEELEQNWKGIWEHSGINPLTPIEMKEWLNKYELIKVMVQEHEGKQEELRDLKTVRDQLKKELAGVLKSFIRISKENSLDELLNIADKRLKESRDLAKKRERLQESIREQSGKVLDYENRIKYTKQEDVNWKTKWSKVVQKTTISADTPVAVAEKLLQKYEECTQTYKELIKTEKDQKSIEEQISLFNEQVENLLDTIGIPLEEKNHDMMVSTLYAIWQQAKEDQVTFNKLLEQQEKAKEQLKESKNGLKEADNSLNDLFKQAHCQNIDELKKIELNFIQKKELRERQQLIEDEMLDLGNGKKISELVAEAGGYDSDTINGEIDDIDRCLDSLEKKRSGLEQDYGVVKKEYEEKIQGNSSTSAQLRQERNSLHTQIVDLTDEYIQLKLASILLRKGIEEYRSQNQNPIISRAGEIFAQLTCYSFIYLTVDYYENDQPVLMGVRENGEKVTIDGMSEGTRDQLYLSIRIASIEKYISESEPIPFIVDDILVHFDDERSKETLKVLVELSKHTQVIFFTHHSRLIDIMKGMADENQFETIEINHEAAVLNV